MCASALEEIVAKTPLKREELVLLEEAFERIRAMPTAEDCNAPQDPGRMPGIAGRVVVVSAAAQGIGQAIAVRLAQHGAKVVCCDLASNPATDTVKMIQSLGGTGILMDCDVTDRAAVDKMFATTVSTLSRLDMSISVVGGGERKPFLEQTSESYLRCVELTQHSHWHFQQSAARHMVALGQGGKLVLIGSIMQAMSVANVSAYQMAKSALPTLTKCIANELAPHKIRCNLVRQSTRTQTET